jgi:hypothetical protein
MSRTKLKEHKHTILAKSVDSLYLYLETTQVDLNAIIEKLEQVDYEQSILINGLPFTKVKAWVRMFPHCMRHGQFMFFVNRRALYIKVLSLAFEMRGYNFAAQWLCNILDKLAGKTSPWMDRMKVSRIDVYTDFAYAGDFELNQFRTKLRKHGFFQSGVEAEGKTIYFGSRSEFMVRLYVKSAEVQQSGKQYLEAAWRDAGHADERVWRLEFEFHRDRVREILKFNELVALDDDALLQLWAYGINALEYCARPADNRNLSRVPLDPLWADLQEFHRHEYGLTPQKVKGADLVYRRKRARTWVLSWLAACDLKFENLPEQYIHDFEITRLDYEKARNALPITFDDEMAEP